MAETPTSIQTTATIGIGTGGAVAVAIYLCHPSWPPPDSIIGLTVGSAMPVMHLIGRGIYNWVAAKTGAPPIPAPAPPPAAQGGH